jgi:NAD(P)H-dependent FMN reductase
MATAATALGTCSALVRSASLVLFMCVEHSTGVPAVLLQAIDTMDQTLVGCARAAEL